MSEPRRLAILGATGSIGRQALDVVRELRGSFPIEIIALGAGTNVEALAALAHEFGVFHLGVAGPEEAARLRSLLPQAEVVAGPEGLAELASLPEADLVLNAVVGAAGLVPTLAALEAGKTLLLANKESLVIGGELVLRARRRPDQIIPVDSEHAALFQLLSGLEGAEVERAWITASGGPFRNRRPADLAGVTPAQALAHPVWPMGRRITVDSATLVNKAFEVIEAHYLFGLPWDGIGVLVHPQACVHALVELVDGVVLAQLSVPDMRIPIRAALTHPHRLPPPRPLALPGLNLTFEALDPQLYPGYAVVLAAGQRGGTCPAAANAADEVLVEAFLQGEIPFPAIAEGIEATLSVHDPHPVERVSDVLEADRWARACARDWVAMRRQRE